MIFRSRGELMPIQVFLGIVFFLALDISFLWTYALITLVIVAIFNVVLVEAYLHRYITHKSYKMSNTLDNILAFFSAVVPGTGSPIGWCAVHTAHHRFSDTPKDPHSAEHNSFLNLLLWKYNYTGTISSSRHVFGSWQRILHKYYVLFMLGWLGLWCLISIDLAFYIVVLPWILGPVLSTVQNYFLHVDLPFSYTNFKTKDNSKNSPLMHILSFGACGLHNNHHANPANKDCRTHEKIDTAAWFISKIEHKD
jgi:stearoyl-CoA desaturase (delta-9 desaturase)